MFSVLIKYFLLRYKPVFYSIFTMRVEVVVNNSHGYSNML